MAESIQLQVPSTKNARTPVAPGEIPPFWRFEGRMESMGNTKIRNLPGFAVRNIIPSSLVYRTFGFLNRVKTKHFGPARTSFKPFFVFCGITMGVSYAMDYYGGHVSHDKIRKYH